MFCDNINNVHDNITINEETDGIRVCCKNCKKINVLRIDPDGRMDNRSYADVFKKDCVQAGSNLYYKVYPQQISII